MARTLQQVSQGAQLQAQAQHAWLAAPLVAAAAAAVVVMAAVVAAAAAAEAATGAGAAEEALPAARRHIVQTGPEGAAGCTPAGAVLKLARTGHVGLK